MDWPEVKARLEQYVHESCLPVRVSDLRAALQRVEELERLEVTDVAGWAARAEAAEAKLARVVEALENDLSDDSPNDHGYSTCTAGEGDEVNAQRGCQRCRAFLALAAAKGRVICDTHHLGGGAYYKDECPSCLAAAKGEK